MNVLIPLLLSSLFAYSAAVDRSKFRTCKDTHFCNKHRQTAQSRPREVSYHINAASIRFADSETQNFLSFLIYKEASQTPFLEGKLSFLTGQGSALPSVRVHVTEIVETAEDERRRWENPDVLQKDSFDFLPLSIISLEQSGLDIAEEAIVLIQSSKQADIIAVLFLESFAVHVYVNQQKRMEINGDRFFHFEHRDFDESDKNVEAVETVDNEDIIGYGEDGAKIHGDESKSEHKAVEKSMDSFDGFTDTSKFTSSSLGVDISFFSEIRTRYMYGIPEHASHFALQDTVKGLERNVAVDPYRLYNLDVFQYELDEQMALYGSIPLIAATDGHDTIGVFWHNPTETFVDISSSDKERKRTSHWISESGVMDMFLLLGPTPADFSAQYTMITGRAYMPPIFALGYHQCRWNYNDEEDVRSVNAGFDTHLIPYDVLWLDIEHTDGKRYFTWDEHKFPNPREMQAELASLGRKLVTIVDPHIKRDASWTLHEEATEKGYYIKDENGNDFRGWCWPGDSSYVDFTDSNVRHWWSSLFRYDHYVGSTSDLFIWNDMNEPSVFNGPEVSMKKSALNIYGVEHREWHNLYGFYMQMATAHGLLVRQMSHSEDIKPDMHRPFVLSRSFFAGSQRFGAVWNGDNMAEWEHLKYATKMLLSMSVAGLTFVGADIGGFFGNPSPELLTRWYQAAVFHPFFRGHAHLDSARREPWLFGEPHTSRIRTAIQMRYSYLPYIYTLFHTCATKGTPVMRPIWFHFSADETVLDQEDAFLLGHDLLIRPVTAEGITKVSVFLPSNSIWYNIHENYRRISGQGKLLEDIASPIEYIPVFQRGGSILSRKLRPRRNSARMRHDPLTIIAALDTEGYAKGELYLDDEETLAHAQRQEYLLLEMVCTPKGIRSKILHGKYHSFVWVEKIQVYGLGAIDRVPNRVILVTHEGEGEGEDAVIAETNVQGEIVAMSDMEMLRHSYDKDTDQLIIHRPAMLMTDTWNIRFE